MNGRCLHRRIGSLCLLLPLLAGACATQGLYDWGSYDASVAEFYTPESDGQIERHIEVLANELEQSKPERIPPGKAAHVGFLYYLRGDSAAAKEFFLLEKRLFPESQVFIDRLSKERS